MTTNVVHILHFYVSSKVYQNRKKTITKAPKIHNEIGEDHWQSQQDELSNVLTQQQKAIKCEF